MSAANRWTLLPDAPAMPNTPREAHDLYGALGIATIPCQPRSKEPVGAAEKVTRTALRSRADAEPDMMFPPTVNIAVLLGGASGNLGDVDGDVPEARALLASSAMLALCPAWGRASQPHPGHYIFRYVGPGKSRQWKLTAAEAHEAGFGDKATLLEYRAEGAYTLAPPGEHADGDRIVLRRGGALPEIEEAILLPRLGRIATLAVLVRRWPRVAGARDECAMALTGALILCGLSDEETDATVRLVAKLAGDEEGNRRGGKAVATRAKIEAKEPVTGMPRLCEILGIPSLTQKLWKWLGGAANREAGKAELSGRDIGRLVLAARGGVPLVRWQGAWYEHARGVYDEVEDAAIRREIYEVAEGRGLPLSSKGVSNVADGLGSLVLLDRNRHEPPCWLDGRDGPNPRDLIVCRNGAVHLPTGALLPHTPDLFTMNALPYDFEPAATCPRWWDFLFQVFPDEWDCVVALCEWFGYFITAETSQQKILALIGRRRSGKGTIIRVLRALVGAVNCADPKLRQLGETFGRESLIGKRLAVIADLRIGRTTDVASAASTLLEISGEDAQTIPRKHRDDWHGKLDTRFVIASNEAPSITDHAGVLATRFIVLQMRQSFLGRENPRLTDELVAELPGILNWSMMGWRRLRRRGRLTIPATSGEVLRQIERLQNTVTAFIEDECVLTPGAVAAKENLYERYRQWCATAGVPVTSRELFGRDLIAAADGRVTAGDSRELATADNPRPKVYRGIRPRVEVPDYGGLL